MKYRKKKEIVDFFGVSILMSFYKKLEDFKRVLPKNAPYFERNGIEIILLLDEPTEKRDLLAFTETYPFINFRIVVNQKEHDWRNHCKVLNVGIRQASFEHILVLDPEVELVSDVVYQLRYAIDNYLGSYATGVVAFIDYQDDIHQLKNPNWMPYGSIMAKKEDLLAIGGYDESFEKWGGEDDQIRRRLELHGLRKIELSDAKTVHRENKSDGHQERSERISSMPIRHLKHILYPKRTIFNSDDWGYDFKKVVWDWKTHKSRRQLELYLLQFEKVHVSDKSNYNQAYQIIALIQVRNESRNLPEILRHLNDYCDGIILLDDGSTDFSYEIAESDKILVKAKKIYSGHFDDLENRNILLRLANFFKAEWFFYIDADERFDSRFGDIRVHSVQKEVDVYRFQLVDIWDNLDTYRVDMPDNRHNGIATRARMFRNKGSLQIHSNREIHFSAVPYAQNVRIADLLLLHYGNFDQEIRKDKYKIYTSQDPDERKQAHSYAFLKDKKVVLKKVKDIDLKMDQINSKNLR
ncbi:galactosyltransferase-related protein [Arenibacter latericius]|uniref:galactosyltransferase-related protein n=1 Tax=Arenibacter latericius TaxID=86104 RepID=UPI0004288BE6|nr:galactosyltransferase-related protein [Arenibacter latericius]